MTASQTAIPAKRSQSMTGPIAAIAAALMVAVIGTAIAARPVAVPASISAGSTTLTTGHDEARPNSMQSAPLTRGHDEARPTYVQSQPRKHVPGYFRVQPQRPAAQPTKYGPNTRAQ